jgi:hypothetical protein
VVNGLGTSFVVPPWPLEASRKFPKNNQKIRWVSGGQHAKGQPPAPRSTHWPELCPSDGLPRVNSQPGHTGPPWAVGVPTATTSSCQVPPPPPRGRCGVLTLALLAGRQPPGGDGGLGLAQSTARAGAGAGRPSLRSQIPDRIMHRASRIVHH